MTSKRMLVRLENLTKNCVYPIHAKRTTNITNDFEFNNINGFIIGLYLAEGHSDEKSGIVSITNNDKKLLSIVSEWFTKQSISCKIDSKTNNKNWTSTTIRGYSTILAIFFKKLLGDNSKTKLIPPIFFNAPDEFLTGLLNGYYSGDGCITKNSIDVSSASKQLIEGISMILTRFGIFSKMSASILKQNNFNTVNISPSNRLSIRSKFAKKFAEIIQLSSNDKNEKLKLISTSTTILKHSNMYSVKNDTILDEIISMERIPSAEKYPKVYDISVPSTLNFGLANGLQVYDTAETGYLQRKLMKSMEDVKIGIGNYVQTFNGQIIQFLYGGDSMDATYLEKHHINSSPEDYLITNPSDYFTKGHDSSIDQTNELELLKTFLPASHEIFLPFNLPRLLNNTFKPFKGKAKTTLSYDFLYNNLIETIDSLKINGMLVMLRDQYIKNITQGLLTLCAPKMLVSKYSFTKKEYIQFLQTIKDKYLRGIVDPGECVGPLAAQAIGESLTQMSVERNTKVILKDNDKTKIVAIGDYIDTLMEQHEKSVIKTHITEDNQESTILTIPVEWNLSVPGLSENEKVQFGQLTEVSRHPVNGSMVKVSTKSGRTITATMSHSFLTRENNKVVPIKGSQLKVGTIVPIIAELSPENTQKTIRLTEYINTDRFIIRDGLIYSAKISSAKTTKDTSGIPVEIPLDYTFGCFIGQVLSDCHVSKDSNTIQMMNTEMEYIENTRQFCEQYNLQYTFVTDNNPRGFGGAKPCYKITISSRLFVDLIKMWCGTTHNTKHIPEWTLNAPDDFLKGLLSNYFDGDGNVFNDTNHRTVRAHGSSKELLYGIGLLLTRFGIMTNIHEQRPLFYEIALLSKHIYSFSKNIGFNISYKRNTLEELIDNLNNTNRTDHIDKIKNFGTVLNDISIKTEMLHHLNSFIKKDSIGRECLKKFIPIMEQKARVLNVDISNELMILKKSVSGDVLWDTITKIEVIHDTKNQFVYDFSVRDIESFACSNGLIVHNTLNTFHSAGIASQTQITAGIPRFRELINVSKAPQNSTITMELKDNTLLSHIDLLSEHLKYSVLTDFTERVDIHYDSNSSIVPDDNFYDEPTGESPWVLVLTLNDASLVSKRVYLNEIVDTISSYTTQRKVIVSASHDNAEKLKVFIRPEIHAMETQEILHTIANDLQKIWICGNLSIDNTFTDNDNNKIVANGGYLEDILALPFVNPYNTISNNISNTFDVLGMEATRELLFQEIQKLLSDNGIYINSRHTELLVDTITHGSILISMDRHGVRKGDASVLSASSFEETVDQLAKASVFSQQDNLLGVTPAIMLGQIANIGTCMNDIVYIPPKK
jgi:DNA-directed RNA polymerase subunit A"